MRSWFARLPAPVVLLGAVLLTRLSAFCVSFYSGDEATYSALAGRILSGQWPYVGAVDHKPPGIALLYALVYGIAGRNHLLAVRLVLIAAVALNALLLMRLGDRLLGRNRAAGSAWSRPGPLAGLLYAIGSIWGFAGDTQAANTELILNLPVTAAALLVATAEGRSLRLLAAGALTGLAGLFKYQAALVGAAFAFAVFFGSGERSRRVLGLALLAGGFGLVAALFLGSYALTGRLDAMLFWGWAFNFQYMSTLKAAEITKNVLLYSALTALFWSPLLLLLGRVDRAAVRLLLPWAVAAGLAIAAGGRFFLHYYLMALPAVCLLAAGGAAGAAPWRCRASRIAAGLVTAASLVFAWSYYTFKPGLAGFDQRYRTVAAWIALHSQRDERIFVWGNSPEIYYYADRVMGTRFPFCNYHTGRIWGSPFHDQIHIEGTEKLIVPRAWDELLRDLRTAPPELIIDAARGKLDRFDDHPIQRYEALREVVEAGYELEAAVDGVPIYRRRSAPLPTAERG